MLEREIDFGESKEGKKYKTLATIIDKYQYRYTQVYRKGRIAIYKQSYRPFIGYSDAHPKYEVIIIRMVKGDPSIGTVNREAYPSTIDWGKKGWSYFTYEKATVKLGELLMKGTFL